MWLLRFPTAQVALIYKIGSRKDPTVLAVMEIWTIQEGK
jgi:hypothetical protein